MLYRPQTKSLEYCVPPEKKRCFPESVLDYAATFSTTTFPSPHFLSDGTVLKMKMKMVIMITEVIIILKMIFVIILFVSSAHSHVTPARITPDFT